jgi:hypothetical protein
MTDKKPSSHEEEYFRKVEADRIAQRKAKAEAEKAAAEEAQTRAACRMRCPKDGARLEVVTFQGIEIDRCPECLGTWFDAGEARRIVEKELKGGGGIFADIVSGLVGGRKKDKREIDSL